MAKYDHQKIEKKWQRIWEQKKAWRTDLKRAKNPYYNLMMFPYPSAEGLHVGNVYAFTASDIHGRFRRMQGNNVFEPIGFDSFGIHSENFAIKQGTHPKEQTQKNIAHFTQQLKSLGALFDWDRAVTTSDPSYYKWTQWLFLQLYKAGLVYKGKAPVDWCPSCKTVLADEQVIEGKCERCESEVIQKELEQWFFKITKYADRLLRNLDRLSAGALGSKVKVTKEMAKTGIDWTEKTKLAQRNWIGKSEGAQLHFPILNNELFIEVFTTRPETLFGATYMVLAPEHPLLETLRSQITNWQEVEVYGEQSQKKTEIERTELAKEKTGVQLRGVKAINPASKQEIPVFIADYVLASYGTGAIMAVPAHDERDFEFAQKYNLPIVPVIYRTDARSVSQEEAKDADQSLGDSEKDPNALGAFMLRDIKRNGAYTKGDGILINSGEFNDMRSEKAKTEIPKFVKGKKTVKYHLRDWLISRQRYWGPPIPVMYCRTCREIQNSKSQTPNADFIEHPRESRDKSKIANSKSQTGDEYGVDYVIIGGVEHAIVPVPEKDLPVLLPEVEDFRPTGTGKSPLASVESFVRTKCPNCKGDAERETDVSDTFLDSAWYFFRYPSTEFNDKPFDKGRTKKWLPVNMYIGGHEHAVLHLLYTRFITMALKDMGHCDFEEPFEKFRAHGLITRGGAKMSKSKGNVVNPDEYIATYGADTVRTYLMFIGPMSEGGDWSDRGIVGIYRFFNRLWNFVEDYQAEKRAETLPLRSSEVLAERIEAVRNRTIKKATVDLENLRYNTAIAALMEYFNTISNSHFSPTKSRVLDKVGTISKQYVETLLILLSPFAPYVTAELWEKLGNKGSVHKQPWPAHEEKALQEKEVRLVVQVNGRVRDVLKVTPNIGEKEAVSLALQQEKIKKWFPSGKPKNVVFVKGRLLNLVSY